MLRVALPAAAARTMTHPERGTMTFQTVVETMAGHDLNHLAQLSVSPPRVPDPRRMDCGLDVHCCGRASGQSPLANRSRRTAP